METKGYYRNRIRQIVLHVAVDFIIIGLLLGFIYGEHQPFFAPGEAIPTLITYIGIGVFKILVFALAGIYLIITKHFSITDSIKVGIMSLASSLAGYLLIMLLTKVATWRFFDFFLWALSEAFLLISVRFVNRLIHMYTVSKDRSLIAKPTIIIGAGMAGKIIIEEIRNNKKLNNEVVAIVDDDVTKIGSSFSGFKVFGPIRQISNIIRKFNVQEVVIAIANLDRNRLFEILSYMDQENIKIKRLPLLSDLSPDHKIELQEVDIHELLGRDVIPLENEEIAQFIYHKTVLITGAGGSIGSELARQIYKYKPTSIVLFDIYENGVYDLQQEFLRFAHRNHNGDTKIEVIIGSTYNDKRLEAVFAQHQPHLVFHAAAYKHVPLMESCPQEAIRTNVIGTYNVALMAEKYEADKMVLVSTDKAVRPTNVMGATKAYAEMIMQHFNAKTQKTSFSAVRFGNVLASNGSVIPVFKKQIEAGGPLTVTDARITRYFMTIPEAVGLILQSGVYAKGGEIFVLDMGKPIKIVDLAEKMIRQSGFIPYKDIKIEFIGLRPGEKLYEELLIDDSKQIKTPTEKIFIDSKEEIIFDEKDFIWLTNHINGETEPLVVRLFKAINIERPTKNAKNGEIL